LTAVPRYLGMYHEMKPLVVAESFCDACLSDISDDIPAYRCSRPTTTRRFGDDSGPKYLELLRTEKRRGGGIIPTCEYALCVRYYNDPEMRTICKMYAAMGHGPTQLVPPASIWGGAEGDQTSGFEDELRHVKGNIPPPPGGATSATCGIHWESCSLYSHLHTYTLTRLHIAAAVACHPSLPPSLAACSPLM
jgi:hypothetical protein